LKGPAKINNRGRIDHYGNYIEFQETMASFPGIQGVIKEDKLPTDTVE
jgi:hypothetical protein